MRPIVRLGDRSELAPMRQPQILQGEPVQRLLRCQVTCEVVVKEEMPADDMRAKQWPALAAGLNGHGASPKWRPAVVDQRARQTFDRPLLVPEHVRWKLSVEELFDPVDDANRGERISTEGKKIVLHANRRH